MNIVLQYIRNTDEYISKLQLHQHLQAKKDETCFEEQVTTVQDEE